jgi:hypothetical protein
MLARLEGGERDNDSAHLRQGIAELYLKLGEQSDAAHWYIEAAKYVEWCELGLRAIALAKRAVAVAPESLEAQRELRRLWGKYGIEGEPPPN